MNANSKSFEVYISIFEFSLQASLLTTPTGLILAANTMAEELFGYSEEELIALGRSGVVDTEDIRLPLLLEERRVNGHATGELTFIRKNCEKFQAIVSSNIFKDKKGYERTSMVIKNLSKNKKSKEELKNSQKKYENLFENAQIGIFRAKIDEPNILEVNEKITEMSGYTKEELYSDDHSNTWLNPEELTKIMAEVMSKGFVTDKEVSLITKNGNVRDALVSFKLYPEEGYFEGTVLDITERKKNDRIIIEALSEKEVLLKEIHHRVKNNLMVISSLLSLQSQYIKDKASQDMFKESQNRARSMALIHERLYQSTDLKRINFGHYIRSLSTELFNTYRDNCGHIKLKINVEDIFLDINTSIPLGLILNEIFTNSLTHAFSEGKKGEVNVEFHPEDDHYKLIMKDNGIGIPEDIDFHNIDSLGLQLIMILTNQIDGNIKIDRNNGTTFKITFKDYNIK